MNDLEREVIILNSAWQMIDGMVNWAMLVRVNLDKPANLMFQGREHQKMFVILLRDFLSQVRAHGNQPIPLGLRQPPQDAHPADRTFLFHLRQVCEAPRLNGDSVELRQQVEALAEWLEEEFVAREVWLPDIDVQVNLRIARYRYITMCGDIAKHHLGRLSVNARHIQDLLRQADWDIDEQMAYLAIDNFFQWFFDNIFLYHSSQIAEFLNYIRWAIFRYLQPEFARSYHLTEDATPDSHAYSYHVPEAINQPIARAMYWDLMNRVRREPWMPRLTIHEVHKRWY